MKPSSKTLYVRSTSLMGFEEYCRDHGVDVVQELKDADIDPAALSDFTQLISLEAFNVLMLRLAASIGDENIGLELAISADRTAGFVTAHGKCKYGHSQVDHRIRRSG